MKSKKKRSWEVTCYCDRLHFPHSLKNSCEGWFNFIKENYYTEYCHNCCSNNNGCDVANGAEHYQHCEYYQHLKLGKLKEKIPLSLEDFQHLEDAYYTRE